MTAEHPQRAMSTYYEVDSIYGADEPSITLRYSEGELFVVHAIDPGTPEAGEAVVRHVRQHYGAETFINHVVLTHPRADRGGLEVILDAMRVEGLWMLRPWLYSSVLASQMPSSSAEAIEERLRRAYPELVAVESLAEERQVPIHAPFQGESIGSFDVLAPSEDRYRAILAKSLEPRQASKPIAVTSTLGTIRSVLRLLRGGAHPAPETAPPGSLLINEEEMVIVQQAGLAGDRVYLPGSAGPSTLAEASRFLEARGDPVPGEGHALSRRAGTMRIMPENGPTPPALRVARQGAR